MGSDNVDIFKKIIFTIPSAKKNLTGIIFTALIFSFLNYLAFISFTSIDLKLILVPFLAIFFYMIPSVLSGEILHQVLSNYPRKWGYFLALSNQFILFIYGLILSGANNSTNAWHIFWLGIITLYLSNFFVLLLTVGNKYVKGVASLSFIQPLVILASFHIFVGYRLKIPVASYLINLLLVFFAAFLLVAVFLLMDYLMSSNVSNVSALNLITGLLQKRQEALDLGYDSNPEVQTLEIENESDTLTLSIPWIHPGPLEGFGGGRITSAIIDRLNKNGNGFFLHVPSTHASDPADPTDSEKIIDAMKKPDKIKEASKLITRNYGDTVFHGRKIDEKKIVYLDAENYDDFEISIFRDIIDPQKTIVVDLHSHEMDSTSKEMFNRTHEAEKLRENFKEFLEELESLETENYRAGFHVKPEDTPVMALVEEVDGQETLLFGVEGNEASPELLELKKKFETDFDQVVLFTTDTHRSIHDLASEKQVDVDRVIEAVEKARKSVSAASVGFTTKKSEKMKILKGDYWGLIFSINILVRVIPLAMIFLYLALVIWVF